MTSLREAARLKRKTTIRKRISGTAERPRLSVFRSAKHIYAQIIDDSKGVTLVAAASNEKAMSEASGKKTEIATELGKLVAQRALENGIKTVVFDRNGFLYHGRVKAVSDGAREAGLIF